MKTGKTGRGRSGSTAAEHFAHHSDQLQRAAVADAIVNPIGILTGHQDAFFAQDGQVLRNVALRGPDRFDDFLHARLLIANQAQDFQAQGMRNRLERTSGLLDVFLLIDEVYLNGNSALTREEE